MAISYTNNFKNILDKLRNVLRAEFKNALPVYIGHETKDVGTQYLRLNPIGSELLEYNISSELREFTIEMYYYFSEPNVNKNALDQVLRVTSRIEALIHDNISMTLSDSSRCINCRIETTELNALDEENEYVVQLTWIGQHLANVG
tara:strand:+ start:1189 stop:1626 length:438 start_codon:yes stop_codon:yes gene_type:complete